MAFQINTNIASMQAQENLRLSNELQAKTISRVTSGLRIVASGDDAAGLAIANAYRSDISVLTQGVRNANDGLSQLQIIDGGLSNISKLLDRARTLATQSASGTFTGSRTVLNAEFQSVISEINRQAQAIGLNTGGFFAKNLSVFIGGGKSSGGISEISNGSVAVDLSASTVDAQSLGLSGVRAASIEGTDLSTSSSTSVQNILNDTTNKNSLAVSGFSDFYFRGAGFSDDNAIKVSVNLAGITDTSTLVTALNSAIETAGNGGSAAATAFKNANIKAVVVTDTNPDGTVKERIGFISSNGAFQVEAGDRVSNAILGNFADGATGKDLETILVGGSAVSNATTTGSGAANIIVRIQGAGLSAPVDLTIGITRGTTTGADIYNELKALVDANETLKAAGITLDTPTNGQALVFRSSRGGRLDVQAAGDTDNLLGLGTFKLSSPTATSFDYTSITGSVATVTTSSTQTFEFSLSGGAKTSITVTNLVSATATALRDAFNAAFAANSELNAAGFYATESGGAITITNSSGTAFRLNAIATGAVGTFGFGSDASTGAGTAFTGNYADAIYGTTAGTTANITTSNNVFAFSINGGPTITGTITTGTAVDITQIEADIQALIGSNGNVDVLGDRIIITGAHNTKITIQDASNSINSTLGFTVGDSNYADKSTVNSGGAYTTGVGNNNEVFSFSALRNGNSDQTITISALDPQGLERSLSVVLQNDSTVRNARTVDEAVKAINEALQQSGDPTLKKIVAVKEQNADGSEEGIRFLSTLQNFKVALGTSATSTAAAETGIYDGSTGSTTLGQGIINSATQSSGGGQLDISTLSGAQAAVTALAEAVTRLGHAQGVVGRGQNQFAYAVNLAQSQLSNIAAAESRIRDADLAAEAANLTKAQIAIQAGIAALAQANSAPNAVLALLRG
jgi:Flagellin and related hook-associated proteins